ncbi:hypothetical protein WEN_02130 [Mycoplasma wenyonii str. Massachusetts]|uniref:Uncharacterized protein n=1 Tax=Mycoplasma wenyonii (strain Massachusetts) TaxID=1197325 RepID=I6ZJ27_MYCWM|nr:hypothetical protein [Mycoplasma wenyonii]AFN65215.1 hypothetical protein WEN_02130 [Mycoplasma wenyonii str. Massachusetts]
MFPSILKFVAFSVTGIAGAGILTPLSYIASTQDKFQSLWNKTLNNLGKLINCDGHGGAEYSVEMISSEHKNQDLGLGVTFNLVKKETSHYGRSTNVKTETWNSKVGGGSSKWGFKRNTSNLRGSNEGEVGIWYQGKWTSRGRHQERISSCSKGEQRIVKIGDDRRREEEVDVSSISLEAVNCKGWFTKTCDIQLSSNSGLKWSETFKPTVFYSPF